MARKVIKKEKVPLIVICSEGNKKSAEIAYFANFSSRNLRIKFADGEETDPQGMLEKLLRYLDKIDAKNEDDIHVYLVLDTDLNKNRINDIKAIKEKCEENNIKIITSAPTFEIWFLFHERRNNLTFTSSAEVKRETKKVFKDYKEGINIFNIIKDRTDIAIENAKFVEKNSMYEDIEINPHSKVYEIIEDIYLLNGS